MWVFQTVLVTVVVVMATEAVSVKEFCEQMQGDRVLRKVEEVNQVFKTQPIGSGAFLRGVLAAVTLPRPVDPRFGGQSSPLRRKLQKLIEKEYELFACFESVYLNAMWKKEPQNPVGQLKQNVEHLRTQPQSVDTENAVRILSTLLQEAKEFQQEVAHVEAPELARHRRSAEMSHLESVLQEGKLRAQNARRLLHHCASAFEDLHTKQRQFSGAKALVKDAVKKSIKNIVAQRQLHKICTDAAGRSKVYCTSEKKLLEEEVKSISLETVVADAQHTQQSLVDTEAHLLEKCPHNKYMLLAFRENKKEAEEMQAILTELDAEL